jgi:2-aminoethylphosphonate-pyruvate transaminase
VITCVTLPEFLHFATLAARLKEKGIVIYNGKGPLRDKLFQIGHIGALKKEDTLYALHQLDKLMTELRAPEPAIQELDNDYHEALHDLA